MGDEGQNSTSQEPKCPSSASPYPTSPKESLSQAN